MAQDINTVDTVDLNRYSGKWYEIARFTKWFEKGMTNVTAEYTPMDGYIRVVNRGMKKGKWKVAKGRARVVEGSGNSKLRVSFFWPFSGDYWIVNLDPDYKWAIVSDGDKSTMWILSRTPVMEQQTLNRLMDWLRENGFDMKMVDMTIQ